MVGVGCGLSEMTKERSKGGGSKFTMKKTGIINVQALAYGTAQTFTLWFFIGRNRNASVKNHMSFFKVSNLNILILVSQHSRFSKSGSQENFAKIHLKWLAIK